LKLTLPIINFTTIFYGVYCFQTWRIASNEHLKALSDPILVANGCCDQKLEHLLCLTNSKVSKLKLNKLKIILPIIKLTTIFNSLSRLTTLRIAFERYYGVYLNPTLVPNGCWDQKMDHIPLVHSSLLLAHFWLGFWLSSHSLLFPLFY
jgi:hypothetical protein